MKIILHFFILTFSLVCFAQLPQSLITPIQPNLAYNEFEGTIYSKSRFSDATVIDEKSGSYDAQLRYNIHTDAIEFEKGIDLYAIIKKPSTHVRIENDYYYYSKFEDQRGRKLEGYYILVELNPTYRIYKKQSLKILEPREANLMVDGVWKGKITKTMAYYLEQDNIVMELPMNKKGILTMFSDKKKELESYIRSEKIKIRKEEDLIRVVSRYSALKSNNNSDPTRSLLSNN